MFRAELQVHKGGPWLFVAISPTSTDAWNAVRAFAREYYAAQVITTE